MSVAKLLYISKCPAVRLTDFWGDMIFSAPIQDKCLIICVNILQTNKIKHLFHNYFVFISIFSFATISLALLSLFLL